MFARVGTFVMVGAVVAEGFPVTYTNCGVSNTVNAVPTRVITMNQGATEFLLAMGLEANMVGTAYLDDSIWPKYASAYATIPVLSETYPEEAAIFAKSPDFIVASYSSAFRAQYVRSSNNKTSGIFTSATVAPCSGPGSDWGQEWTTCRPQLNANGQGTYVFEDACENTSLRPDTVTEETVYEELRVLGGIFNVSVQPIIDDIKDDFDQAAGLVSAGMNKAPLKTVWLDCVGRCCEVPEGQEKQVYVGAGFGVPNMLMREAGLKNMFSDAPGNWDCVNVSAIVAADPDVIVVADAAWDTAADKIKWLNDDDEFCQLEVLKRARFVSIPFSATTLSPRSGPAALDLAIAALHVRTGAHTASQQSGVGSFNPYFLQAETACGKCPLNVAFVEYDDASEGKNTKPAHCTTTAQPSGDQGEVSKGMYAGFGALRLTAASCLASLSQVLWA